MEAGAAARPFAGEPAPAGFWVDWGIVARLRTCGGWLAREEAQGAPGITTHLPLIQQDIHKSSPGCSFALQETQAHDRRIPHP